MSPLNAAVSVSSESNHPQNCFRHRWSKFPLCALFLMLALFSSRAAYAVNYIVTNTSDTNDGSCGSTCSLRDAVNAATSGSDTINFASNLIGTITLTNGVLAVNNNVTISGPGANLLTISGNNAAPVFAIYAPGTVNLSGLTIANGNNANNGGGIDHIYTAGTLAVSNCTFSGNTTAAGGGAIANGRGVLTVENSTFVGNSAGSGGAAGGLFNNSGTATVENSTFYGNSSPVGPGGGIFNNGTMTINNSTIMENTGDGIFNNGGQTLTVSNSIVAGNTSGDCDGCGTQSAPNLIGGTPNLGPLQYNGGRTQTMMPLPGSAVIGAGSSSALATDQRGFARSTSGASDLGAVSTNYLTVTTTADSSETTTCTGGATCSLRDAITVANTNGSGDVVFQSGLTGTITITGAPTPEIMGNLTITGTRATPITFSQIGPFPFEMYTGSGANVALSGLTVTNAGSGIPFPMIALILNESATLAVNDCTFSGNDLPMTEGIVLNESGTLMVTNSTFSGNSTEEGGAIFNNATATVTNSTFSGNSAYEGGAIYSEGPLLVADSTFSGNIASNAGYGGGIYNAASTQLILTNSIVAGNTSGSPAAADDCANCGTQSPSNRIGGLPNLGVLASNGLNATVQTMLPLPGSPAIQAGDPTLLPVGLTTDERGFPRLTGGKLDLGAAQTNYTAIQFVQQPTHTVFNADISPAVTLEVLETNTNLAGPNNTDAVDGIPLTLVLNGSGIFGGTLTQTTSGGVATFSDLTVNATGTGNTLGTSLTVTPSGVTPALTLAATSDPFDVTLQPSTVSFNPPLPASVTYGVAPLTLQANAYSGGTPTGQTLSFQVDSGPATVSGNVLTITGGGTVVVEVDAAANGTYAASDATASIAVAPAVSSLALTASANQAAPGTSVTLTATATSTTPGTTATPSGTVTFMANGNSIGTAQLTAGVATLALTTLPGGSNTITANYPGDTNFLGSTAQLSAPIAIGTPTFTMTSSVSSLSIQPGQSGTVTLTLTPSYGYTGTVNFNCNSLPLHSTCNFSPTSVTLNGSASPVTVTLTVATSVKGQARTGAIAGSRPWTPLHSLPVLPAVFFWLPGTELAFDDRDDTRQRKRRTKSGRMLWMMALLILGAGLLGLTGCGGMSYTTPAGQQTVTVVATGSGGISQSIAVQVSVQ